MIYHATYIYFMAFSGHNCPPNHLIFGPNIPRIRWKCRHSSGGEVFGHDFWGRHGAVARGGSCSELMVKIWGPKMGGSPKSSR